MSTADAVAREAAFLAASGDGLPALLSSAGGPWDIVQAYRARTPATRQTAIYLLRTAMVEVRFATQRKMVTHDFRAILYWPIGSSTTSVGIWENESAALDAAVDLLIQRVRGTVGDHSHGGRFLSVAEAPTPGRITVHFDDPDRTAAANPSMLLAEMTYSADDRDFTG